MPDQFVELSNGLVLDWNGIDRVARWDGITADIEVAGVVGPTTAPSLGYSTTPGRIIGEFYGYVRFIDRYGNYSNLSPLSNKASPLTQVGGSITGASNASPIVITTSAAHGLGTGQLVKIEGCYGNSAANGYWLVTAITATTFSLDGSTANGAYNSGGRVYTGSASIIYTGVQVPTDAKVVRRQILRNQDGDLGTFYVDIDTEDITSTQFESNLSSDDLAGADPVPIEDLNLTDLAVSYYTPPPAHFAAAVLNGGRVFAAVTEPYSEGCVSVTNGSRTVTGIGVEWNQHTFPERFLTVRGDTRRYEIASLSSMSSLVLVDPYQGSTDPYAHYVIAPDVDQRRALAWSAAAAYEAFPPENIRQLPEDTEAGEPTTLFAQNAFVYYSSEYWTYRFGWYKNPNLDGGFSLASERGCVNRHCAVSVGGTAYLLDYLGVHAFSGNDDMPVSEPLRDLFRPRPNTPYRINWKASRYFHACYDPGEGVVKFFVALDGEYTPRHALVLDFKRKRWAIERHRYPVGASTLGRMNGRPQLFYGTRGTRVMAANYGTLDGPDPTQGTIRGTVTTAGPGWIADSTATFASSGLVGYPVVITEGTGRGQERLIYSVSGTTKLYVRPCWSVRPDTTSVYQVGGIPWVFRSGWLGYTESPHLVMRELTVMYQACDNAAGFYARMFDDTQEEALDARETKSKAGGNGVGSTKDKPWLDFDLTKVQGLVRVGLGTFRDSRSDVPRYLSLELGGTQGRDRQSVWGVEISGTEPA